MSEVIVGDNLIAAITNGVFHTAQLARIYAGTQKFQTSPASIMVAYVIEKLGKMTDPSDKDDWPLYTSHLPDGSNVKINCGVIHDTAGVNDPRSMTGEWPQHPGVQLRIRSRDHETGYKKIEDVASALDEVVRDTIEVNSTTYEIQNVSRTSPIVALGVEPEMRRFSFTVNFLLTLKVLVT